MDLNALSGPQRKILRQAILDAFNPQSFTIFLADGMDKDLNQIAGDSNFTQIVFEVIRVSQQQGWTDRLIKTLQSERPDNTAIKNLLSALRIIDVEGNEHLVERSLEKTVKKSAGIADFAAWAEKLERVRPPMCRIEDPRDRRKALGTGFLVSRDLVLTNYHVVEMYIDVIDPEIGRIRDTNELRARFDYALESGGVSPGITKPFAPGAGWIVDYSKYSRVDPGDQGGEPATTELDFALLRLAEPVGDAPGPDGQAKRGWISLSTLTRGPEPTDVIFIVQHPNGEPLKLAVGGVTKRNGNGTRLRYDTNTEPGSSGSPCFDAKLDLVALHHAGDPTSGQFAAYNQGIPIDRIISRLATIPGLQRFWV